MNKTTKPKIIFIIGGLFSGIGKGIIACSIGKLLKNNQLIVSMQKQDPYLNVDCGLMNPSEHGEVFVTKDGLETDLDLGNYERFLEQPMSNDSCFTSGQIYQRILNKERQSDFFGKTINVFDVVAAIKQKILFLLAKERSDCIVVEIGGSVGDHDLQPFLMAAADLKRSLGYGDVAFVFLTYVNYFNHLKEFKTKLVQNSIISLRTKSIEPDFVILRSEKKIPQVIVDKIAHLSYLHTNQVFSVQYKDIYEIPLTLVNNNFFPKLLERLNFKNHLDVKEIQAFAQKAHQLSTYSKKIKFAVINKYSNFKQSYLSLYHSIYSAALKAEVAFDYQEVDPESLTPQNYQEKLKPYDGIIVPGGFGTRGVSGKILAINYARKYQVPFFGICFGMQLALLEFARAKLNMKNASSEEFFESAEAKNYLPIIEYFDKKAKTMFVGIVPIILQKNTMAAKLINQEKIQERHRNRLIFNNDYRQIFEDNGMVFSGIFKYKNRELIDIMELKDHPFFMGTQFHGEFHANPNKPKPLMVAFLKACWNNHNQN